MKFSVVEHIHGLTEAIGYQRQSTLEGFKNVVMQKATFTDSDYYDYMDSLNIELWNENKEDFKKAEIDNESWNEIGQIYTRTRTWPSKDVYDSWMAVNDIVEVSGIEEPYAAYTRTEKILPPPPSF